MSNYDDSSIKTLYGAERVRKRPASMLGSNGLQGAQHGVIEMYGNAVDEASSGYGTKIDIKRYADGSISIRDYGRGVPLGWNEKDRAYNWHLVYNELYSGGKYDNYQKELKERYEKGDWKDFDATKFNYLFSVGLNGLGAASTQYTSEFFDVISIREENGQNIKYTMHFEKGLPIIDGKPINVQAENYDFTTYNQVTVPTTEPTGTFIHWKPDNEVFSDTNITKDWLYDLCYSIAYVAGIDLYFSDEASGFEETIEAGTLKDLFTHKYGEKLSDDFETINISQEGHGLTKVENKDFVWVADVNIELGITTEKSGDIANGFATFDCFHNTVRMQGGKQYEAVFDAITQFVKERTRKKSALKVEYADYAGMFYCVLSSHSNYASFRNQTKDEIDDNFLYTFIKDTLYNKLTIEYEKGSESLNNVINEIVSNAQVRTQLKEYESQVRDAKKLNKKKKNPEKFLSCKEYENKDYHRTELWITEGDSAKSCVVAARDSNFQAVYPIRGKGLNVSKANLKKILANQEISDILSIIGTGIDMNIKGEKLFNINDLKFDKIVIATDADVDGYQIRVLCFLLFYKLAPELLLQGHVYVAETPRYAIKLRDGSAKYALDEKERDAIISQVGNSNVATVSRFKGLGEVEPKVLRDTTVGVQGRNLKKITIDKNNKFEAGLIDTLFGEDKGKERKDLLITVLGAEVADELEENKRLLKEIEDNITDETEKVDWS